MVTEEGTRFLLLTFVTYTHREVSIKENTLVFYTEFCFLGLYWACSLVLIASVYLGL